MYDYRCKICDYTWRGKYPKGCENCAGNRKKTQEEVENYFKENDFEFLGVYNSVARYKRRCLKCGYEDYRRFEGVKIPACSNCATGKYDEKTVIEELKSRNIKLLSPYRGTNRYLDLECKVCKHTWKTKYAAIVTSNSGCPQCSIVEQRFTQEYVAQEYDKAGIILSSQYIRIKGKNKLRCKICDYNWEATFGGFYYTKNRCPKCAKIVSKGEEECRKLAFEVFGKEFKRERCQFLKNPNTGRCLELDGVTSDYKIAFEYQGQPHYLEYSWFKSEITNEVIKRDQIKRELCAKHNIYLIEIPFWEKDIRKLLQYHMLLLGAQNGLL